MYLISWSNANGYHDSTFDDDQIDLEYLMVQSGIKRYQKQMADLSACGHGAKTLHGRAIVAGVAQAVALAIDEFIQSKLKMKVKMLLKQSDPRQLAYLSLISVVDRIAGQTPLMGAALFVGTQVETQQRLEKWIAADKQTASYMIKQANKKSDKGFDHKRHGLNHKMNADGVDIPHWSRTDRIAVGMKLISLIVENSGIAKIVKKGDGRKTTSYVVATESTLQWVKTFNETKEKNLPRYAPCIIEPKDWDSFWGGGYYSDHINQKPFVKVHT